MRNSAIRRNLALLILFGILSLNVYIILTLPSARDSAAGYPRDVDLEPSFQSSHAVSHLQLPRKRLNKSNYTSDSLAADGGGRRSRGRGGGREGGGGEGGGGGAGWEEVVVRARQRPSTVKERSDKYQNLDSKAKPPIDMRLERVHDALAFPARNRRPGLGNEDHDEEGAQENSLDDPRVHHHHLQGLQGALFQARTLRPPLPARSAGRPDDPNGLDVEKKQEEEVEEEEEEEEGEEGAHQNAATKPEKVEAPGAPEVKNFTDPQVDAFLKALEEKGLLDLLPDQGMQEDYWDFLRRQRQRRRAGSRLPGLKNARAKRTWEQFHKGIRQHSLYDPDSPVLWNLLKDLGNSRIVGVEQKDGGTQIKLIMTFDNDGQALFKPMRFPRETETLPDHFYFADYERHVAEIGAFYLDMVLGYNRVPPVAGRSVNMTRDIRELADKKLAHTFFISPAKNLCFHGTCSYYCDSSHPVCGHPEALEGSLMAFLPPDSSADRLTWRNPWKRSYSKRRKAYWETYDDLCLKIKGRPPYDRGRRLMDIVDMSVLDFLMGNLDRHHYETFEDFGNDTFILHLDNGRGFGKQHEDDLSCLAPLVQCCMLRLSTLQRLARLYAGPRPLSFIMARALSSDQVNPVLIEGHLRALDRRLLKVLQTVKDCAHRGRPLSEVIIDDGVY